MQDLSAFFHPRSIAVIGASPDPHKVRGMALHRLREIGFRGEVWPVNPGREQIMGWPAFATPFDLPEPADLALLVVSSSQLCEAARQCGQAGIRAFAVFAGLPQGDKGKAIQAELQAIAKEFDALLLGPNALGFWNPGSGIAATFAPLVERAADLADSPPRKVSIVSQSGGVANSLYDKCHRSVLGVRYVVSTGNEAGLDILDVADFIVREGGTKVLILYVEGFQNPSAFEPVARLAAERAVAMVVIKVGTSEAGERAAISHTAHLTGSDTAYDAVFERLGVLRVEDLDEALVAAKILATERPMPAGRVLIVSTGGGFGALLADACSARGIAVPELGSDLRKALDVIIPDYGFAGNPVDLPGGYLMEDKGASLAMILEKVENDERFDAILICFGLDAKGRIESLLPQIEPVLSRLRKVVLFHSPTLMADDNRRALARFGIYDYSVSDCARALLLLRRHASFLLRYRTEGMAERSHRDKAQLLRISSWEDVAPRLANDTTRFAAQLTVRDCRGAVRAAEDMGFPVALKIVSADIQHKTEVGGVITQLTSIDDVRDAYAKIVQSVAHKAPHARIDGMQVQAMAPDGVEISVGMIRDPDFGPLIMVSAGGVLVELLDDTIFAPLPLSLPQAHRMIACLKCAPMLDSFRGGAPRDREALARFLVALAELVDQADDELVELEFNPVIVHSQGAGISVVDMLAVRQGATGTCP